MRSSKSSRRSSSASSSASSSVASSSSASSSPPSYSSVLKSTPGSSSRSSSISRSSTTSLSSATSSFSPKPYLTIHDLYMRYAPLKSLTKSTAKVSLPRVLPPMTLQDLLNKFAPKMSATPSDPSSSAKTANPPAPQPPPPPQPTAPSNSPQDADKAHEEPPAKTRVSTVDKHGRDVTRAGMKDITSKSTPIYQRWCTFGPRWPQRSYPLLTPLSLARIGYTNAPTRGTPQRITCVECRQTWEDYHKYEQPEDLAKCHDEACSFKQPDRTRLAPRCKGWSW